MFKKSTIAVAVALGLGVMSQANAAPITFDVNGAAAGGVITFNNLTWQGGNALVLGALSTPLNFDTNGDGVNDSTVLKTVTQTRLSSFNLTSGGNFSYGAGTEITVQSTFWEIATGIGGPTAAFSLAPLGGSISMWYDASPASFGDDKTGKNYGSEGGAVKILDGNLISLNGNFSDLTRIGLPTKPLDCDASGSNCVGFDGNDQAPGTLTNQGFGNQQILVDVTYQNSLFFLSNISSLIIDASQSVGVGVPFNNMNPWTDIVGETPSFSLDRNGQRINGGDCVLGGQTQSGVNSARCDQLLQTTGLTSFNTIPEPGSLALLGLGLASFGFVGRRRKM